LPESVSFPVFGGLAVVAVADAAALEPARARVDQVLAEFDLACSRFRPDSELCALNAAAGEWVTVSPVLLEAIQAAVSAAQLTDGDVDPTIGQALIALGYDRDFEALRAQGPVARPSIAAVPGWRTLQMDEVASRIRLPRGVVLDLGATAKALCADRAARAAAGAAGCGVLVSLGGDLAIAGPSPPDGWRVRVTDDHRSDFSAPGQWIVLRSGGLATSSTAVRRWPTQDGVMHHLVDPSSGRSAGGPWRTVSVTAASCLEANIASTATIIRGEPAAQWLESLGLPSRLVDVQGTVHHLAGWPAQGDDLPRGATPALAAAGPDRGDAA
jgi:thiamine biosynthesis lipoprotein